MKEYIITKNTVDGPNYVYEISKSSIYVTEDIHNAMKFDSFDTCIMLINHFKNKMGKSDNYGIVSIETVIQVETIPTDNQ